MRRAKTALLLGALSISGCGGKARQAAVAPPTPNSVGGPSCAGAVPRGAPSRARQMLQAGHTPTYTMTAWSKRGLLATGSQFDETVRFWDVGRRALLGYAHDYVTGDVYAWDAATPGLSVLFSNILEGRDHRKVIDVKGHVGDDQPGAFLPVLRGPSGDTLGVVALDGQAGTMKVTRPGGAVVTLTVPAQLFFPPPDEVLLSRDGTKLLGRGNMEVAVWSLDAPATPPVRTSVGDTDSLALSPDLDFAFVARKPADGSFGDEVAVVPLGGGAATVLVRGDALEGTPEVAVSPDGKELAAAVNGRLVAWDRATSNVVWVLAARQWDAKGAMRSTYHAPSFSPDGATLIVGMWGGPIAVLDAKSGRLLGRMGEPVRPPDHLLWTSEDTLAAGSYGHVALWDTKRGVVAGGVDGPDLGAVARTQNGDLVTVRFAHCYALRGSRTNLWFDGWKGDVAPDDLVQANYPAPLLGCDKPPEGAPHVAYTWPPPAGVSAAPVLVPGNLVPLEIDVTRGLALVASSGDRFDSILDLTTGTVTPLDGFRRGIGAVEDVVLRAGWVVAPARRGIDVWDARTGKHVGSFALPECDQCGPIGRLAGMSDDGTKIAVAALSRLAVYELPSGKELARYEMQREAFERVLFAGDTLFLGTETIEPQGGRVYRVEAGHAPVKVADDPSGAPLDMALSPSGARLAVTGRDGAIRLYDLGAQRLLSTLVEFDDDEYVAYTPGGAYRGTEEVAERVSWIFDAPTEPFRFEQFARVYQRSDVVEKRLAGGDVDVDAGLSRPPGIEIAGAPASVATSTAHLLLRASSPSRVDEVRVFVEGREVARKPVCAASSGDVPLDVPLLPGTNRVTAVAYDDRGFASNAAVADVLNQAPAPKKPDLWIVALGVSKYPHLEAKYQLEDADADARGIADGLTRAGAQTYGEVHAKVLVDEEVTVGAAEQAMATLAAMGPDDLAVVFFAGHGIKPTASEDMVFLTAQTSPTLASVRENGVGWRAISDALAKAKGRVVVLLDACHAGHVSQELVVQNDALAAELSAGGRAGVFVFAAAKGRQFSLEPGASRAFVLDPGSRALVVPPAAADPSAHGYFTGALLASLGAPETDTNGDGQVQMSELVDAVTERVTVASHGVQTPWIARREILGDFGLFARAK